MEISKFTNNLIYEIVDNDYLMKDNGQRYSDILVVVSKVLKEYGAGGYDTINTTNKNRIKFRLVINGISVWFDYNILGIIRRKKLDKIMNQ